MGLLRKKVEKDSMDNLFNLLIGDVILLTWQQYGVRLFNFKGMEIEPNFHS